MAGSFLNIEAAHPHEPDRCTQNQSGQPHSTDRGPEQVDVFGVGTFVTNTVRAKQIQPVDVTPERSPQMVVLAMHVIGDGPAQCDELGAGRDGQEITMRRDMRDDIAQKRTAFSRQQSRIGIELEYPPSGLHGREEACIVVTAVTIGTTISKRQQARTFVQGTGEIGLQQIQR